MRKAIIGGTGIYGLGEKVSSASVVTPYGTVAYDLIVYHNTEIVFLSRHGKTHHTPPHKINYLANMAALKALNVTHVLAICAVGSMNDHYEPGDLVIIKDFIDFTKNRIQTYFQGDDQGVAHVEMTDPYCKELRKTLYDRAERETLKIKGDAVYVCTEGPRFETASEIKMYKLLGGDVVGMTNVPESVLAKELGICYAAVGVITNWCTGIEGKAVMGHVIEASMKKNKEALSQLFLEILSGSLHQENCQCVQALIKL